jgi:hypothetical protein
MCSTLKCRVSPLGVIVANVYPKIYNFSASVRLFAKVLEQIDVNKDFDGYTLLQVRNKCMFLASYINENYLARNLQP